MSARETITQTLQDALPMVNGRLLSYRVIAHLRKAGYVILSPDEVRALERDRQAVEFAARWCWRTDPPNANSKLTDAERLSAIKYHPTIKRYGQPHIELAERESSLKGGRDAQ